MAVPLLQTKLYIPPPRPELISRPRLIERLDAGLGRKLTLVSAPAGFGKTTLLSEWIAGHQGGGPQSNRRGARLAPSVVVAPAGASLAPLQEGGMTPPLQEHAPPRMAWLSLDENDNDLIRFLTYLVAALQTVEPEMGRGVRAALQEATADTLNVESILTALVNECAALQERLILVLDDYHVIEADSPSLEGAFASPNGGQSAAIDRALAFLLEHMPPPSVGGLHLVIATRTDPSLPLSRLRARRQMTELRTADLRFTGDEVAALFQATDLPLSSGDVQTLEKRTEGWITGLHLAALALQSLAAGGLAPNGPIAHFIQEFGGSHRYVIDYLVDEVLEHQPDSVQRFLLQTSILDRLSAPLCNALLEREDSQALLEQLEAANLFTIPLDGERRWYRYHHLFGDLLAHRLAQAAPDRIPELHRRASLWYERDASIDDAFRHALAAGDAGRAAGLVEEHWAQALHHGELTRLKRWLDLLGAQVDESAPLCMARCWIHHLMGKNDRLAKCIQETRTALAQNTNDRQHPQLAILPSLIETMEAVVAQRNGKAALSKAHAKRAIELIPHAPDPITYGLLHGAAGYRLAFAHWALGEYDQAADVLLQALDLLKASENCLGVANAVWLLATIYRESGHPRKAIAICQDTLGYIHEHHWETLPSSGMVNLVLAELQADAGERDAAQVNLEIGQKRVEPLSSPEVSRLLERTRDKLRTSAPASQPLVEPLSPRELEILRLVAQGLSNREICERLYLALSTVKGHNRNIYGKLQVTSRTQAVARARELGLL